jgi:tRNA 2-thiouridine synthesizing protein A
MEAGETADAVLDLRGLKCPLPALFARRALAAAAPGAALCILTDDPMAPVDIPHMCRQERYEVIALAKQADGARFILRRPPA